MESYCDGLIRMLLKLEVVTPLENENSVVIFATGCAIIGIVAVALDLSLYVVRGQSILKLEHGKNTIIFLFAWAIGSFIMGYIGQLAKLFQVSLFACALVGFTWPFLCTKLLQVLMEKESEVEPEQIPVDEVSG